MELSFLPYVLSMHGTLNKKDGKRKEMWEKGIIKLQYIHHKKDRVWIEFMVTLEEVFCGLHYYIAAFHSQINNINREANISK